MLFLLIETWFLLIIEVFSSPLFIIFYCFFTWLVTFAWMPVLGNCIFLGAAYCFVFLLIILRCLGVAVKLLRSHLILLKLPCFCCCLVFKGFVNQTRVACSLGLIFPQLPRQYFSEYFIQYLVNYVFLLWLMRT